MTEVALDIGINSSRLLTGLAEASQGYDTALSVVGAEALTRQGGTTDDERRQFYELNPDIFVPNTLALTEDIDELMATDAVHSQLNNFLSRQYLLDAVVGEAVAFELSEVTGSKDARDILPPKTVAIVEVNANRAFRRGLEDPYGCYGLRQNHLGHVVIDAEYLGEEKIGSSHVEQNRHIDLMREVGSVPDQSDGLARNAARIFVRPSYPLVNDPRYMAGPRPLAAREVFEARRRGLTDTHEVKPAYTVLRSEYRICRAVGLVHELNDWFAQDFESRYEAENRFFTGPMSARNP